MDHLRNPPECYRNLWLSCSHAFPSLDRRTSQLHEAAYTKNHGILLHLLNNFTLGGTYYRTSPQPELAFMPGSYRDEMCRSPATRRAWPLLKRMIMPSPYRNHLDELFGEPARWVGSIRTRAKP